MGNAVPVFGRSALKEWKQSADVNQMRFNSFSVSKLKTHFYTQTFILGLVFTAVLFYCLYYMRPTTCYCFICLFLVKCFGVFFMKGAVENTDYYYINAAQAASNRQ